jgi:hypothetical protein
MVCLPPTEVLDKDMPLSFHSKIGVDMDIAMADLSFFLVLVRELTIKGNCIVLL